MSITFQAYSSPYACDIDDRLSVAFHVNEFLILLSLEGITHVKGWDDSRNGAALLALQVHPLKNDSIDSANKSILHTFSVNK
jgi:hypothetical protein